MRAHPFPESVPVLHGAPLLHTPRGTRRVELTLARIETEAAVGRARVGDLVPVFESDARTSFHERDGALWARVVLDAPGVHDHAPEPAEFADFLSGRLDPGGRHEIALMRHFGRTPLSPRDRVTGRSPGAEAKRARGRDLPPKGPGLVLRDGRDRCAGELRRFLAEEVLVTEAHVYRRTRPLVWPGTVARDGFRAMFVHSGRTFEPGEGAPPPMPFSGYRDALRRYFPAWRHEMESGCVLGLRQAGWLDRSTDADLAILANAMPGYAIARILGQGDRFTGCALSPGLLAELYDDAFLAMTGSIEARDAPAAIARSVRAIDELAGYLAGAGLSQSDVNGFVRADLARYCRKVVLERSPALAFPEDAADIAGLAP